MKCPYCGRDVVYSDRFCKCGAELDMVVCPHCGTPNITLATFCGNCGTILLGAEPYVPEPEEEAPEEAAAPEEETEELAAPEEETEELVAPEEETEELVAPEEEVEEPSVPEEEPEEVVTPEEEPAEPVVPDEEAVEPVIPEPEPEEPVVSEEEVEEPSAPEEESVVPEEEPVEPLVSEEETEEAFAAEGEPEEPVVPSEEPEEAFAAGEEPEEPVVPPEEPEGDAVPEESGGGGRRRRGGLIALWIVIAIIVVVVIVLLVWATRGNRGESTPVENEENLSDAEEEGLASEEIDEEEEETEVPATVSDISFDRKTTADNQEYAVVTAKDEDGNVVWDYTTPQYAEAELDRVSDIGLHGDSYFLIQDGAVVSLDKSTGDTLWENGDYGGSPVDHSWDYAADGLYLCGYEGPAIYGVSYDGDTLGKIDAFDDLTDVTDTNLWPYKVSVSGNEATVYYGPENVLEEGDKAVTENEATVYRVNLDTWEYTLISNGAAKVESTSGNNANGSNGTSGSDNGDSGSDSSGGSGSGDSSGSNGGSGSGSGSGSNGGSSGSSSGSGSGSGSGSNGGGSGSGSGSGSNGGSSGSGSGSGSSSGSGGGSGSGSQSSAQKISMSDVKDVTASSYLYERNVNISHDPKYLVDGTLKNAWCEDASGDGIGQWAKVEFNGTYTVSGMNINAGYQKSESLYYENCRPKEITITFSDGSSFNTTLEDVNKQQNVSFSKPVSTSSVTITIRSVYKGSKYEDTCISEVAFY